MFPLRDENPTVGRPWATFGIIALNAAAWIFVQGLGMEPALVKSLCQFGAIPGELLGTLPAGLRVPLTPNAACVIESPPNWFSLLTWMFMHGGWFHIVSNLWFLYVFGDNVEDSMGAGRFVVFYLLCGLASVLVQAISMPASGIPIVGASGAIGGVMGAYAVLYPRAPVRILVFLGFYIDRIIVPAYVMLGCWLLIQLLGGIPALGTVESGVAFWAHIGGFVAGVVLVFPFRSPTRLAAHRANVARLWERRHGPRHD
jgi:membrane associated rhomboid family serine protease